ncbi:PREDICTED: E3 ubiquitin/ISG15 ligase TRIM25-like [Nanorana parkeri]|uniref:E3 ubiquitin/ISG15 ligase TRIM25-like n=1 Tax=Nanorana parkeri TaxID=125878 RepID=UPI000854E111|nr:PREDICTED: E3 ubiquitin/ISG15 ligase TRIM25-like [Nanorana parkeri]
MMNYEEITENTAVPSPPSTENTAAASPRSTENTAVPSPRSTENTAAASPRSTENTAAASPPSTENTAVPSPPSTENTAAASPRSTENTAAAETCLLAMASSDLSEDLNCSSCLDAFSDLITLTCGHNFCRDCFFHLLSGQERVGGDTCPVCTPVFPTQPGKAHSPEPRDASSENPETASISCTFCIHSPVPAAQSCLHCEASLCAGHLRVHTKSPEHILTKPTKSFRESKCSAHNKILDFYCRQDKLCICLLCCVEEHRGHRVCHFQEAFEKTKEKREYASEILTAEMEEIAERVRGLQERKVNARGKAADIARRVSAVLGDVRRQQDDLEKRILSDVSWRERQICLSVSNRIRHLEESRDQLCRKMGDMAELYETPDPSAFSRWMTSENSDLHKLRRSSSAYRKEDAKMAAAAAKDFDEALIFQSLHATLLDVATSITRGIYVQEVADLRLDVNTAANNVAVTQDLKEASCPGGDQCRIEKEERFDFSQALSVGTFGSGRHYWDVEVGESGNFRLGVAYSSMERKGGGARIGNNDVSWCLGKESDAICFIHNTQKIQLGRDLRYQKIRIYLDYEAGQVSFYELGDRVRHLHTFTANFTEPLRAAFCVFLTSWVRILS